MGFEAFRQRAFLVCGLNMLIDAALAPYLICLSWVFRCRSRSSFDFRAFALGLNAVHSQSPSGKLYDI